MAITTNNEFLDTLNMELKKNGFKTLAMKAGFIKIRNLVMGINICAGKGILYATRDPNPIIERRTNGALNGEIEIAEYWGLIFKVSLSNPKSIDMLYELLNDVQQMTKTLTNKYHIYF